ncbi:MAG: 50S ribosomal protein L21 [Candidatus Omnitrophica bacterium CG11_big_fil_rev_8_21_14_0_20_42_13]|uniref:Large ribosomal subunit protein bL21 n=1 Tax=Candidatus Ghiorseimicrobium undicola TaxID=1974746 RepID=A0A2H0LXA4_9BACT|nr:MAG: 50S ribosomal protein L21 [Candidatus Omnitrophica bacterium CG11_big_fil_rev_8_21_14_0_20_42_13]
MYAIIEVENKQYKVAPGDVVETEKLKGAKRKITFDKVLLVSGENITIGRPYIKGAKVSASITGDVKSKKVIAFKFKRRKGYHRKVGHRQNLTRLKIEEIKI